MLTYSHDFNGWIMIYLRLYKKRGKGDDVMDGRLAEDAFYDGEGPRV